MKMLEFVSSAMPFQPSFKIGTELFYLGLVLLLLLGLLLLLISELFLYPCFTVIGVLHQYTDVPDTGEPESFNDHLHGSHGIGMVGGVVVKGMKHKSFGAHEPGCIQRVSVYLL